MPTLKRCSLTFCSTPRKGLRWVHKRWVCQRHDEATVPQVDVPPEAEAILRKLKPYLTRPELRELAEFYARKK